MESHNSPQLPLLAIPTVAMPNVLQPPPSSAALDSAQVDDEREAKGELPQKRSRPNDEKAEHEATAGATSTSSPSTASTATTVAVVNPVATLGGVHTPSEIISETETNPVAEATSLPTETCLNSPSTTTLRKFRKIPIFIVDYHNDVLEFLYRCLASRHLPLQNNIMVHFDSHPDLVINRSVPASDSYNKQIMLEKLGIESWIMPSVFTGHFNRIVWVKNSWCQQIPVGTYNLKVGQKDDKICVDSSLDYFMSEANYCHASEMEDSRDLELQVFNADTGGVWPDFISAADAQSFVLDIDLDFFSTANPFLAIYSLVNSYERLTEIFHFETSPTDCNGTSERRLKQLNELRIIFEHLEKTRGLEDLPTSVFKVIPQNVIDKIKLLHEALKIHYPEESLDWSVLYDSGCTTDSHGLPHHVSTDVELDQYFTNLKTFLEQLPVPPVAVTIACSAADDYCPKFQVDAIQERVLHLLRNVFGERIHAKPTVQYLYEHWDVMHM